MTKIVNMNSNVEEDLHPFHSWLIEECGVGYYPFRTFVDNLDDELLLESLDEYIESNLRNKEV